MKYRKEKGRRSMERFTVYLIHKWREEGDSVKRIAKMLGRDPGEVAAALELPLTEAEGRLLRRYYIKNGRC